MTALDGGVVLVFSSLAAGIYRMGTHVTTLTAAYEELLKNVNEMFNVSNTLVKDLEELIR